MACAASDYFRTLSQAFAAGWNRFWFTPSDPYPLGLIRFLTGMIAVWLQITLLPDVERFFSAGGWLPLEVVERTTQRGYVFSYLSYLSLPNDLLLAHCLGLAVLVLFTVGLWTRLTSVLALVVILSNVHRAPMITTQLEPILTMVLFYLCLGPAGASWSVDRWLARRKAAAGAILAAPVELSPSFTATLSLRLMQVHLAMLVATMGTAMLIGEAWWTGMGVWLLAARPDSRLLDLTGVHRYVVNFWTHLIVAFELAFPILVWIRLARPLLLGLAVVVWISLAVLTGQITFALMLIVASLSFYSPSYLRGCTACCQPTANANKVVATPL